MQKYFNQIDSMFGNSNKKYKYFYLFDVELSYKYFGNQYYE